MDLQKITEIIYKVDQAYLLSTGDKNVPDFDQLSASEKEAFTDAVQGSIGQAVLPDIDRVKNSRAHIMNALANILTGIKEPIEEAGKLPVMYIGRHQGIKDSIYNTGLWHKGQTKNIPAALAGKMVKLHIDTYTLANPVGPVADVEFQKTDEAAETRDQDARDHIRYTNDMDGIKDFIKRNFNQDLHQAVKKIETARERAIELIDRYGMPE